MEFVLNTLWPWMKRNKDLLLRGLLCWAIGLAFLFFDEASHFDLRLQLRGSQEATKKIVLVYIDENEWIRWHGQSDNLLRSLKEFAVINDSFFWNPNTWRHLLQKILAQDPKAVGVTFFFGPNLQRPDREATSLYDPKITWAALMDNEGRPVQPVMSVNYGSNTALIDLREDEDRIQRRFFYPTPPMTHLAVRLAEILKGKSVDPDSELAGQSRIINFRGARDSFASVSFADVLANRVPKDFFKGKIVILGSHSSESHLFQTPLGTMTRAEILAHVTDNILYDRWITRLPKIWSALYLLIVVILATMMMASYPQAVAFVILSWLSLGSAALSLWVFDSLYFWIPVLSPLLLFAIVYIVFLGYQLSIKENQTWRLQQQTHLLSELDQLKNNFVSLISHDLKTPIAKIQAICDRLLSEQPSELVREGISNVRKESTELHRYIQTILQISRMESSQIQVRRDPVDINELVDKVLRQLTPLARDKQQNLDTKLEPMFSIEVDSVLIQEVILNLIENAIKYTPESGQITVQTKEVDDKVIFSVRDSGPGISQEDRARIFEKFYRGQAQATQTKGTGLGLFLVKYFVELHGGSVFIESELGQGTTVGFAIPITLEDQT
jgi:two-component system phosphate regulon sensor histidine kinase PhoR